TPGNVPLWMRALRSNIGSFSDATAEPVADGRDFPRSTRFRMVPAHRFASTTRVREDDERQHSRPVLPVLLCLRSDDISDLVWVTRRRIPRNHGPLCAVLQIHCVTKLQLGFVQASFHSMECWRVLHDSIVPPLLGSG